MTSITDLAATTRAVRLSGYGGPEVLSVREVAMPVPGPGEVLVEVRAAGINPGELIIRSGALHAMLPANFPSGQGTDFAGVVAAVGANVQDLVAGDAVMGFSWTRSSHAAHVVVPRWHLVRKPEELPWEVAGALDVAGTTAWAGVRSLDPAPGDVVAVSAATGGVGTLAVQLLVRRGVTVLGIASPASAGWLSEHGAVPVAYGEGLGDRLRAAAPDGLDGFLDLYGPDYVHLALGLGLSPDRVNTVVVFPGVAELGVRTDGAAALDERQVPGVLEELAGLLASGEFELPIAATFPLDRVADAFERLEQRHTLGKIVLLP